MALGGRGKRYEELRKIPAFAARDHRNSIGPDGKNPMLEGLSRKQRRALDKSSKALVFEYKKVLERIKTTGAGYPVDKILHELCVEYTHRYASSGIYNQPLSFNYFETFCEIRLHPNSVAPFAEPAEEIDHLFSVIDFFEYATGEESNFFSLDKLLELPEGKALHFTVNGNITDFTFLSAAGREFVISGFSMVRRGNYLGWYIIGGEIYPPEEWAKELADDQEIEQKNVPPWKKRFLDEASKAAGNRMGPPVALEGTETAQRTIIAGEIDLITQKHLGRCYMSERENTFNVVCDDPDVFTHVPEGEEKDHLQKFYAEQALRTEVMWRLSEAMFQLPAYFAYKVQVTKALAVSGGQKAPSTRKKGGRGLGGYFKTVAALDFISDDKVPVRSFTPNHYGVETGGYWRRLAPDATGKGPHGEIAKGRTWVKSERTKVIVSEDPRPIYVKSTIASAKLLAEQYAKNAEDAAAQAEQGRKTDRNVLYVLRCTVMREEVYKVGWTSATAEERASQISSATGVPNSFIVVEHWQHPDPEALEKNVHALLDPYRLADNREFFKLDFPSLKSLIEQEIARTKSFV
ncbi:GIY-YIG nuclease family protein [Ensifer sp. NPDC090286]|uniref:GIY-YIG nuclease family protein n=1 Tax=Ensifer sp. NPDC090286 TaxID=3363991 RepID=UPI00383B3DDA